MEILSLNLNNGVLIADTNPFGNGSHFLSFRIHLDFEFLSAISSLQSFLNSSSSAFIKCGQLVPSRCKRSNNSKSGAPVPAKTIPKKSIMERSYVDGRICSTVSRVIFFSPSAKHCPMSDSASRMPPSDNWIIRSNTAGSMVTPSACANPSNRVRISVAPMRLNWYRSQRDNIVAGNLCSSVVARIKTTCAGGSSSVFNKALNDAAESMCTSSIIKTL